MTIVAVLGLGEAGSRLAADLVSAGADVRGFDPVVSSTPDGVTRSSDPDAAVDGSNLVLSLATAAGARAAAAGARSALGPDAIFADLNTASPELKRELAELVPRFVDVALLGPVPSRGLATPVLASGPSADDFARVMAPLGMPVEVVSERPGDAAAMKLLRSVFMKGLAAAAIESLAGADALGQREWLARQLGEVIDPGLLVRFVEGSRLHAGRRVEEMEAACALLASLGVDPHIAGASRAVLEGLRDAQADPGP